jgi:hypothetical protein
VREQVLAQIFATLMRRCNLRAQKITFETNHKAVYVSQATLALKKSASI